MNHITQEQAIDVEKSIGPTTTNAGYYHALCNAAIEWHIAQQSKVGINGLTHEETSNSMSVRGLSTPKRPINCGTGYCSCIECLFDEALKAEPVNQKPLTEIQRLDIVTNWFTDEADITRAMQMLTDFEQTSNIGGQQ